MGGFFFIVADLVLWSLPLALTAAGVELFVAGGLDQARARPAPQDAAK